MVARVDGQNACQRSAECIVQSTRKEPREVLGRRSVSLLHVSWRQYTQLARAVAGGATESSLESLWDVFRYCIRSSSE